AHVEEDHVRARRGDDLEGRLTVRGFTRDLELEIQLEHPQEALPNERFVLDDDHPDHVAVPSTGMVARTEKPTPAAASISSRPPCAASRWRRTLRPFRRRNALEPRPSSRARSSMVPSASTSSSTDCRRTHAEQRW